MTPLVALNKGVGTLEAFFLFLSQLDNGGGGCHYWRLIRVGECYNIILKNVWSAWMD